MSLSTATGTERPCYRSRFDLVTAIGSSTVLAGSASSSVAVSRILYYAAGRYAG